MSKQYIFGCQFIRTYYDAKETLLIAAKQECSFYTDGSSNGCASVCFQLDGVWYSYTIYREEMVGNVVGTEWMIIEYLEELFMSYKGFLPMRHYFTDSLFVAVKFAGKDRTMVEWFFPEYFVVENKIKSIRSHMNISYIPAHRIDGVYNNVEEMKYENIGNIGNFIADASVNYPENVIHKVFLSHIELRNPSEFHLSDFDVNAIAFNPSLSGKFNTKAPEFSP